MSARPRLRELRLDLTAAAAIGDFESLQFALDGIRALDDSDLPPTELVGMGTLLEIAPEPQLVELAKDTDPAIRAIAAAALGGRFLAHPDEKPSMINRLADDKNPEVARTLGRRLALAKRPENRPRLVRLVPNWLISTSNHSALTALLVLPACRPDPDVILKLLGDQDGRTEYDVRWGLVHCLAELAAQDHPQTVLELLAGWAERDDPNVWVITRAVSGAWAQAHRAAALTILEQLVRTKGQLRPIERAMQRLQFDNPS